MLRLCDAMRAGGRKLIYELAEPVRRSMMGAHYKGPVVKNILLVEDDQLFSMSLAEMLADAGFSVRCEYEGQQAIDAMPEGDLEAAIVDLGLPDMSGDRVVRALRARQPTLPIYICTGFNPRSAGALANDPAVVFLEKPVDERRIVCLLRQSHPVS
jgi:DNA-binding response OmpR family regulator